MTGILDREALDPKRVENARRRVQSALAAAAFHETQAAACYARANTIIRSWRLCPHDGQDQHGFCCGNPDNCLGRQP